jgi:hypothetical protein
MCCQKLIRTFNLEDFIQDKKVAAKAPAKAAAKLAAKAKVKK